LEDILMPKEHERLRKPKTIQIWPLYVALTVMKWLKQRGISHPGQPNKA
jgi:hypothetical protein